MATKRGRTILTPTLTTDLSVGTKDGLAFWKQLIPEREIDYYPEDSDEPVHLDFSRDYLDTLKTSFEEEALDQTPFMLADVDNAHTMDPERQRGDLADMRYFEDLPSSVKAEIEAEGKDTSGLFGKISFPTRRAARAVLNNDKLGVSLRIREDIRRSDKKRFPAAIIHVLGTLDPKVPGMSRWKPAFDFSEYADGDLIDLSSTTYAEATVAKGKNTNKGGVTEADSKFDIKNMTEEDVEKLNDEDLAEFIEKYGHLATQSADDDEADGEDDDEDPNDDSSGSDDDGDDSGDDADEDDGSEADAEGKPAEAKLSNKARNDIALANATAKTAQTRADIALAKAAETEWKAKRSEYLRAGVPAFALDLSEPVMKRIDAMVVDLANSPGAKDKTANVSKIVSGLLDALKGTVDFSETGHGSGDGDTDADGELEARWAEQYPEY